jgi:glycosyltransferase involved in cell wall biosynthesis
MPARSTVRIFVDCHVFDGGFQGTTTYLKGLYQELIKDRSMHFFMAASDCAHLEGIFGTHDNVQYLPYRSHNKFIRLLLDIPKLIRRHQIDFAHFQYVVPPIRACKYIVTIHDVLFLDFPQYFPKSYRAKNKFLFGTSARRSDVVLTVSDYSRERIAKHFEIDDIAVTPNGVDPVYFEAYDKQAILDEIRTRYGFADFWLYISRWEPRKNHYNLLRAFVEKKHHENYHLVFVGSKAIPDTLYDAYFAALPANIQKKIVTLNAISQSDLVSLVRGASLSAYPSIAEGFGIPPLETAAAKIPTICSNATAMADFEFFGNRLFDPLDPDEIGNKAQLALHDGQTQAISAHIEAKYNWEVSAAAFCAALAKHLG